ncbi:MAG TPA: glycosyltransferase [Bacilli bacterium]|nr:glycosyltransferase [Bacilli bacterium]
MKICFVIGSLSFSGAEKVLSNLIDRFDHNGHEMHVILLEQKEVLIHMGSTRFHHGAYGSGNRLLRIIRRTDKIRRIVKDVMPDVVVSFGNVSNINTIFALLLSRVKLILCERNDPKHDPRTKVGKLLRRILYPLADHYIFQTEEIKSYFPRKIQRRSKIIPNPVTNRIAQPIDTSKNKVIAHVARLDDFQKNQSMLIKTFADISNNDDYILKIYGDGPDKSKYQTLIDALGMKDKIFLCGSYHSIQEVFNETAIFVLTSNFEGMPNALIEAMSFGLPCISTDCSGGGARSLIKNNENGLLVTVKDNSKLKDAIMLLMNNSDYRDKLGKMAFSINDTLSLDKIFAIWERTLKDFMIHS